METKKSENVNLTIRIPGEIYNALAAFKAEFRSYMSLNALIVEAIIEQVKRKTPEKEKPAA